MKSRIVFVSLAVVLILSVGLIGCGGEEVPQYNLTISSTEGGSVTSPGEPGPYTYDEGEVVNLVANAEEGYHFVNWTGDVSSIDNVNAASTTIMMNDDYSISANFIAQYVLTIDSTDGGEITTPGEGTFTYDAGTVVELAAQVEEGYKFLNWTGDIDTVADVNAASTTITMETNCAVTGNFALEYIYFDEIGPGSWNLGVCQQGVEATVTEEGILVNYSSSPSDCIGVTDRGFGAGGRTEYTLKGDFDIRMDYELITWPNANGVRVALSILVPDVPDQWPNRFVSIERVSPASPDFFWLGNREVYLINWNHSVPYIMGTNDLSGTLRICRQGAIVTCYYSTSEDSYVLYEGVWLTEDVYVQIHTFSGEALFGGKEVSVLMKTVEFVEPLP